MTKKCFLAGESHRCPTHRWSNKNFFTRWTLSSLEDNRWKWIFSQQNIDREKVHLRERKQIDSLTFVNEKKSNEDLCSSNQRSDIKASWWTRHELRLSTKRFAWSSQWDYPAINCSPTSKSFVSNSNEKPLDLRSFDNMLIMEIVCLRGVTRVLFINLPLCPIVGSMSTSLHCSFSHGQTSVSRFVQSSSFLLID